MSQTNSETDFLDFLKSADSKSDMTVREDSPGIEPESTEAVRFTDVAQDGAKDTKEGVTSRVLAEKAKSDARERALIGSVLSTRDFETSNIQIKPVEKVSSQLPTTLRDQVRNKLGRV